MENQLIIQQINEQLPGCILSVDEKTDILTLTIDKDKIDPLVNILKTKLQFGFLTDICGIHYPDQELQLGAIYHLHNLMENKRIRLKAFLPIDNPVIHTITHHFSGANWMERETYDFFGIIFDKHPNLKRILNVDCLDVFPLRKEYPLEDPTRTDKNDDFFGR
jgi:NADH-quinone oxidoreductase subunit C